MLVIPILLKQDQVPEGTEIFQLISFQEVGGAPFNPINTTCMVTILDDNDSKCYWCVCVLSGCFQSTFWRVAVVIIELTPDMTMVPEYVGMVQLCLSVTQPPPDVGLHNFIDIYIDLATEVGSAGT